MAILKALWMTVASWLTSLTRKLCLVHERVMPTAVGFHAELSRFFHREVSHL
jgi:hypothetical protein